MVYIYARVGSSGSITVTSGDLYYLFTGSGSVVYLQNDT